MLTYEEHDLLAQVAAMYYEQELTQNAIAAALGLSRVKIYRLLKQAREEGVIRFTIAWPLQREAELEQALRRAFGLREALVLRPGGSDVRYALARLGQLGARYLEQMLHDEMMLTVCLGRSTYEVIHAVQPGFADRVNVVQAVGSLALTSPELDSAALTRTLAGKLGGVAHYLVAPLVADSGADAEVLRSQRDIRRVLELARQADVALVGIGNLDPETSEFVRGGYLTADELAGIRRAGGVGDMAGQIFTLNGQADNSGFNRRVVGLNLTELADVDTVMAVALGQEKRDAVVGALRTGVIDVLCSDAATVQAVLESR
ncbi:MAG: sugar-binding transcriptional regulator [Caldilineaceae bacterium]|nr:sugar-binding transcriptional regulator [Caldilineaceae bacterium]